MASAKWLYSKIIFHLLKIFGGLSPLGPMATTPLSAILRGRSGLVGRLKKHRPAVHELCPAVFNSVLRWSAVSCGVLRFSGLPNRDGSISNDQFLRYMVTVSNIFSSSLFSYRHSCRISRKQRTTLQPSCGREFRKSLG